jgi:hypothetical protein
MRKKEYSQLIDLHRFNTSIQTAAEALGSGLRLLVEREGSFQLIRQVYEETAKVIVCFRS